MFGKALIGGAHDLVHGWTGAGRHDARPGVRARAASSPVDVEGFQFDDYDRHRQPRRHIGFESCQMLCPWG